MALRAELWNRVKSSAVIDAFGAEDVKISGKISGHLYLRTDADPASAVSQACSALRWGWTDLDATRVPGFPPPNPPIVH